VVAVVVLGTADGASEEVVLALVVDSIDGSEAAIGSKTIAHGLDFGATAASSSVDSLALFFLTLLVGDALAIIPLAVVDSLGASHVRGFTGLFRLDTLAHVHALRVTCGGKESVRLGGEQQHASHDNEQSGKLHFFFLFFSFSIVQTKPMNHKKRGGGWYHAKWHSFYTVVLPGKTRGLEPRQ